MQGGSSGPVVNLQMEDPGSTQRTLGWIAGGVGVLGLGAGAVFTLQKINKIDERDSLCTSEPCPPGTNARMRDLTNDARSANTMSVVSFVAGGALIAGGAILILTAPKARVSQAAPNTWILPVAGPDGFGVFAGHEF